MVDAVLAPIKNSNCQEDVDVFLVNLAQAPKPVTSAEAAVSPQQALLNQLPESARQVVAVCSFMPTDTDESLDHQEINVLAYIGGYIVRKLKKVMCSECTKKLATSIDPDEPSHEFLVKKNYEAAKTGLVAPSQCLVDALTNIESEYRNVISVCVSKCGVMNSLVTTMNKNVDLSEIHCDQCHVQNAIVYLMLTIRLHHTLKENNRSLSQSKRKNRKTLKFSHL